MTPPSIWWVQFFLNRAGMGLLALRLLSLLPSYPRYTLSCLCLLVFFKFSSTLAGPLTLYLYHILIVVAASRGADPKIALKLYLSYLVFYLIAGPTLFTIGWAGNVAKHVGFLQAGSYGMVNPNTLAAFLAIAVFLGLYLSKCRRPAVIWTVSWLTAALTAVLTLSRTWTLLLLAMPFFYLFFLKKKRTPGLLASVPVLCLAVSVLLSLACDPGYGSNTFESRFSIAALLYEKNGLSLFGQNCGLEGWFKGEFPYNLDLDNGYLNLFLCSGVVTGLVVMAFFVHLFFLIGKKGDGLLSAVACCFAISGMMEKIPFNIYYSFMPLFYMSLVDKFAPESRKAADYVSLALTLGAVLYVFMPWHPHRVSPSPYGTIGEIPCPEGFVAAESSPESFSGYLSSLPLARPDSVLTGFDGMPCDSLASHCFRVVDLPLIDKNEQCADVCMRLRAEYLYRWNNFRKISFTDTRGKVLHYRFGACRPLFDRYLKEVYAWSSTKSMCWSMPVRPLEQIAPGDVFVYDEDAREDEKYGHAVMVVRVAVDTSSGRRAVMLIQGSTPACDLHIVANLTTPELSPWHLLNESPDSSSTPLITVGKSIFYENDLRYFSSGQFLLEENETLPSYVSALARAYPDIVVGYEKGSVVLWDGTKMRCDDGKRKDYLQRLDDTDIEDMFQEEYPLGKHDIPEYLQDPGRYRCEAFFKKMYGRNAKAVRNNLVTLDWYGQKIPFTRINHAADSLMAVQREMKSRFPDFEPFFQQSSSFNWRKVRGADRMSAHSYGMSIDIGVKFSDYWRWDNPGKNETDSISYWNRIPGEIVDVFEKHGFISGTKWYHYDTMHFEFRPDLLIHAGL